MAKKRSHARGATPRQQLFNAADPTMIDRVWGYGAVCIPEMKAYRGLLVREPDDVVIEFVNQLHTRLATIFAEPTDHDLLSCLAGSFIEQDNAALDVLGSGVSHVFGHRFWLVTVARLNENGWHECAIEEIVAPNTRAARDVIHAKMVALFPPTLNA